jgi:hypothetical protein
MLSWAVIFYGAALSALAAGVLAALVARPPKVPGVMGAAVAAFAGPVAWNAILKITLANQFFVDAPIAVFPVSWQDTGSAVFTVAAAVPILGAGPFAERQGQELAVVALAAGLAALVVDVFLY